jgi:2-methylisocitrate lyase-like PEP mutase family enzyme
VARPALRDALARETPLVTPLAHDALSARLIELAGFHAERAVGIGAADDPRLGIAERLQCVGTAFRGAFCSAAMFEGVDTPWLSPAELGEMGFTQVSYPASLIFRAVAAMRDGLAAPPRRRDRGAEADGERRRDARHAG